MKSVRILGAILSLGMAAGVQAQTIDPPPGAESEPIEDRSTVNPGAGGGEAGESPGLGGGSIDDPTSGAIRQSNFRAVDENRDGYINQEEAAIYPGLDEAFSDLDSDGDDQLSAEEFSTWSGTEEQ